MVWNEFWNNLNKYLANLFLADITHVRKQRILTLANIAPAKYNYTLGHEDLWFSILIDVAGTDKGIELLEIILKDLGEPEDQYLKSALYTLKENKKVPSIVLPYTDWKGGNQTQEIKEKIIGRKSTMLPISFLEAGTEAAKSVVRIECGDELGTGFIIKNNWLLTNNHVIATFEAATNAKIQFGFQYPKGHKSLELSVSSIVPEFEITLEELTHDCNFYTNIEQDWTMIRIPEKYWESISKYGFLPFSEKEIKTEEFVNIIQHPLGGPKQIGIYNNMVMYTDSQIVQYLTDTDIGSSGSPVLNSEWEVVAIHHSGGWLQDPLTKMSVRRNQGSNIHLISSFINNLTL